MNASMTNYGVHHGDGCFVLDFGFLSSFVLRHSAFLLRIPPRRFVALDLARDFEGEIEGLASGFAADFGCLLLLDAFDEVL